MADIEKYAVPQSLEEAAQLLADGHATLLAGGTDLMLQTRAGVKSFEPLLININRIPELKCVSESDGKIGIGALATVIDILESSLLHQHARVLCDTADCFASGQIRNVATLGGNICNGSPAGDMIIPLLLLDAEVELARWSDGRLGLRRVGLAEFFTGPGKTQIEPAEILTRVTFDVPEERFVAGFKKFGTRPALDISVVSVGVAGIKEDGVIRNARVAFGAVAPTPLRGRKTEAAIEGQQMNEAQMAAVGRMAREEISPISDVRGSAWYRKELIGTLTQRLLRDVT